MVAWVTWSALVFILLDGSGHHFAPPHRIIENVAELMDSRNQVRGAVAEEFEELFFTGQELAEHRGLEVLP